MGFTTGAKITADIVEEIANSLIATPGGYWTDITTYDPGATMWNTTVKTQDNAKRALRYSNGLEEIFISMEVINRDSGINFYFDGVWRYGRGIRIVLSASWDSVAHTYPVSNQSTFIPFEGRGRTSSAVNANLATLVVTYYLWIESNGFVIMARPEPDATDTEQQSFILAIERNPAKEYADGYSNFFLYSVTNIVPEFYDGTGTDVASINRNRSILRPFAFQWPDTTNEVQTHPNGYGISFATIPTFYAFRSNGNNKVYYIKPIIHNMSGQISPIFQSDLFFMWSESAGLIDGDVISIEGRTTKYLCKGLDSTDSTNRLTYAIKYVA